MKKTSLIIHLLLITFLADAQLLKFDWAKSMGGLSYDYGNSITTDAKGNVYTTGSFNGTADFDPGDNLLELTSYSSDAFISKLDAHGNYVWVKQLGGQQNTYNDYGISVAIDLSGNIYTVGGFVGKGDFDPGIGLANLTSAGKGDVFISKLDSNGNYVWVKQLGGNSFDYASSMVLDDLGNVYIAGSFDGTADFDPDSSKIFNIKSAGDADIFISKLDASGNFVWAKQIGGALLDVVNSISVDKSGNVYTTGSFEGKVDFDPGAGTYFLTPTGSDIFISKLDASGNFVWAKQMGGNLHESGNSIAIDKWSNIYATGTFQGTADFNPSSEFSNLISTGNEDIFILKLNSAGNFIWVKQMGGDLFDNALCATTDSSGFVYVTGNFQGIADFNPSSSEKLNLTSIGRDDIFISKLDPQGNFVWAKSMGGTLNEIGNSIALDKSGNIYTTGFFQETVDFDPGSGVYNLNSSGDDDIFVQKMSNSTGTVPKDLNLRHVSIYPNPTNKFLKVELTDFNFKKNRIQILNSVGQIVLEETPIIQNSQFNIEYLPDGLYFVKVLSDNQIIAKLKIIKK